MLWVLSVTQLNGLNDVQEEVQCIRTNWSLTVSLTALCKLGYKRRLLKKRKIDYFWKNKNGQGLEISPSVIGKRDEKKFQTFAMWSAQTWYEQHNISWLWVNSKCVKIHSSLCSFSSHFHLFSCGHATLHYVCQSAQKSQNCTLPGKNIFSFQKCFQMSHCAIFKSIRNHL